MSKDYIGFGIVGCGVISPWHINGINKSEGAKLVAVCDIIEEKAQKTAEKEKVKYYLEYEKMLKQDDLDVVCICTPSSLHPDMAILAAEHGKHVISEKPMAVKMAKAHAMIDACKKHKVKLACIYQRRVTEPFKGIKEIVDRGELGKLVLGDMYAKYYRSQAYYDSAGWRGTWEFDGGGALMNQCIHIIDLLQWYMGDVEEIFAYTKTLAHKIEVEDTAVAVLKFKSGAIGTLEGTTSVYPDSISHRLELHGEKGTLMVLGEGIARWEVEGPDGKPINKLVDAKGTEKATASPTDISMEGHRRQITDMVEAIKSGREPMIIGEDGIKALEIILAIYESNKIGKPVKLPLQIS